MRVSQLWTGLTVALLVNSFISAEPCEMDITLPGNLGSEALLGSAVALDGELLAVGAPLDTGVAWASGAVYVYRLEAGQWTLEAKLIADDADWGDMLGVDVDLEGDTLVAGAWFNDAFGSNSGAAYVFTRSDVGTWSNPTKLLPPDPGAEDVFGRTVALGDGFCAVGAPLDDDQGNSSGSIHVFDQNADGSWTHAAKLVSSETAIGHQLGLGLDADGLRILGGSPWAYDGRGMIRLWQRLGSTWSSSWFMTMQTTGTPEDYFGFSVTLDESRMAAGAYRDDTYGIDAGSVWVMEEAFDGWSFTQLPPPEPQVGAQFGVSIALSGDDLLVGSRYANIDAVDSGRADVLTAPSWMHRMTLTPPNPANESEFGWACDLEGDLATVGALYQPTDGAVFAWSGIQHACGCQGDLDQSGDVGVDDLLTVLAGWDSTEGDGDINADGITDVDDLLLIISLWGPCP